MFVRAPSDATRTRIRRLEVLRGLTAGYVFVHHYAHEVLSSEYPSVARLFVFGQSAVMLFFIISGFVVYYSTFANGPPPSFREYFIRRFRRIFPLFLVALVLSYVAVSVRRGSLVSLNPGQLFGNIFMLQDRAKPGTWFTPYYNNHPLWSLSYEWFFYMAFFPTYMLLRRHVEIQKYVVLGISLLGFVTWYILPNQISMFLIYYVIWWSGLELARQYAARGEITWRGQRGNLVCVGVLTALWSIPFVNAVLEGKRALDNHPILEFRHFLTVMVLLVLGIAWHRRGFPGFRALDVFGRLAVVSYALYIFHVPLLLLARDLDLTGSTLLDFLWITPAILAFCWLFEVKLQPHVNRLLPARRREKKAVVKS